MITTAVIFTLAFAFALCMTPLARKVANKTGFVDKPASRKLHHTPMPMLGGIAIFAAVYLVTLLAGKKYQQEFSAILTGGMLISLIGLIDDRVNLKASIKLLIQIVVASLLFFAGTKVALGWIPGWMNFLLTVLWITGITNAINLLDNMDGLSAGVSGIAAGCFAIIGAMNGQVLVSTLAAAIAGSCLAFLLFNSKPATIYMGDAGALFLGFMLAIIGLRLRFSGNTSLVTWMVPVIVLGIPLFDTFLVIVSRLRRGKNPFTTPGKDHLSHRLVKRGLTHREAVFLIYVAGCLLGLAAIYVMHIKPREAYQILGVMILIGLWFHWDFEWRKPQKNK